MRYITSIDFVQRISRASNHYNLTKSRYLVDVSAGREMNLQRHWNKERNDRIMSHR